MFASDGITIKKKKKREHRVRWARVLVAWELQRDVKIIAHFTKLLMVPMFHHWHQTLLFILMVPMFHHWHQTLLFTLMVPMLHHRH